MFKLFSYIKRFSTSPRFLFLSLLAITLFFSFYKLSDYPLQSWDEARVGVAALNMLDHGDYINYYYGGKLDQNLSKPPLMMWSVAGSINLFGKNKFALRLPSAICIVIALLTVYGIICLYYSPLYAFLTCLILLSVEGFVGYHVGRTGDVDAMLVMWLMAASYAFLKGLDFEHKKYWLFAGVFLGLAFYTKGTAAGLILPAWLAYIIYRQKFWRTIKSPWLWSGLCMFFICVLSWYWLVQAYGVNYNPGAPQGENVWENLIFKDTLSRLLHENMSGHNSPFYFIHYLDTEYNLWNYFFYILLGAFGWQLYKNGNSLLSYFDRETGLQWFALLMWLIPAIVLTLAISKRPWYLAPCLPFIAINTVWLIRYWQARIHWIWIPVILLLMFTLGRRVYDISYHPDKLMFWKEQQETLSNASRIVFYNNVPQKLVLYTRLQNNNILLKSNKSTFNNLKNGDIMIVWSTDWKEVKAKFPDIKMAASGNGFMIGQRK